MANCWLCGGAGTNIELNTGTNIAAPTCRTEDCEICTAVAKVEEEIRRAEASLQGLIAKRLLLRSEHNCRHDPILRLPLELSTYIFELCLPIRDKWGRISTIKKKKKYSLPSHFSSICRGWRDIAWSTPRLWSTIRINLDNADFANVARFASDWIYRSHTLPLVIYITRGNQNDKELLDRLAPVFQAVNQCSNRWETLCLDQVPVRIFSGFRGKDQCILRRLRMRASDNYYPASDLPTNAKWSTNKLNIDRTSFKSINVSWCNLTMATVCRFYMEDLVNLFQNAPRMTYCHILHPLRRPETLPTLVHENLETLDLQLSMTLSDHGAYILGAFKLPNLQVFTCNLLAILDRDHLPELVRRSSCHLNKLTIGGTLIDIKHIWRDPERLGRLMPFPEVTHLELGFIQYQPTVIQDAITTILLLDDSHALDYFPGLRFLTLRMTSTSFMWGLIPKILDREFLTLYMKYDCQAEDPTAILNSKFEAWQMEKWDVAIKRDGFKLSARSDYLPYTR